MHVPGPSLGGNQVYISITVSKNGTSSAQPTTGHMNPLLGKHSYYVSFFVIKYVHVCPSSSDGYIWHPRSYPIPLPAPSTWSSMCILHLGSICHPGSSHNLHHPRRVLGKELTVAQCPPELCPFSGHDCAISERSWGAGGVTISSNACDKSFQWQIQWNSGYLYNIIVAV